MADTEALARVLCAATGHDPDVLLSIPIMESAWGRMAERILADPGPLLAALPDDAIEAEALRRFYPARHMTGLSDAR